jgi:hypothetical protein
MKKKRAAFTIEDGTMSLANAWTKKKAARFSFEPSTAAQQNGK